MQTIREKLAEHEHLKDLVVHCKRSYYDVYIGRPSHWGNPFKIGRDGTREEVVALYYEHIQAHVERDPTIRDLIVDLRGKTLGCWCAPQLCHGHVLLLLAEQYAND